jgi:hypothetical protein
MQQGTAFLAPAVANEVSAPLSISWQAIRLHDNILLYLSLALLLLSTADAGMFGPLVKLCWLASFIALALVNIGGALAAYISSLAIYSPLHFADGASLLQRPDNLAAAILFVVLLVMALKQQEFLAKSSIYIAAFLIFTILHGVFFSSTQFPLLVRSLAIPLVACALLTAVGLCERDLNTLQNGLAVLGSYMGLVSILEGLNVAGWVLPPWIGDPSLRPFDPFLEEWIGAGRSGGTLLQPEWNGLLLSLIFVMLIPRARRGGSILVNIAMLLCAGGAFFTYTRGVWLGLALSLLWFPGWCRSIRQANVRRILLVCIAVVFVVAASGMASERLQDSNNIAYRFNLWGAGLRLVMAHPGLGVGLYNFGTAMGGAEQGFGSILPSVADVKNDKAVSHNTFLTVLVEFGIVGFSLYAMAFFKIVQRARNNALRLWKRPGSAWVLAFVIVYLVNAQVVSAFEGATNVTFYALLGVIAGARQETV